MNIGIFSPSYKRAGRTEVDKYFDGVIFCVHQFEYEDYKSMHENVVAIPDNLQKNMAKVRNFILDYARENKYDVCLMIDDDMEKLGYIERSVPVVIDKELANGYIEKLARMAEEFGTVLFGINLQTDPKFYREYSPISLLSPVLGPFFGVLTNTDIRFDERLGLNEDYDFSLQVLHKHHKIYRNNKLHYFCGHLTEAGGCGAYRLLDEERDQAKIMIRKWGSRVVKYDFSRSTNPRISCPLKGI